MDVCKELKQQDLLSYIENVTGKKAFNAGTGTAKFKVCPICGKGDHFTVNTTGNYYNGWDNPCGKGTIIDFCMNYYGADIKTAIADLKKYFNLGDDNMYDSKPKEAKKEVKPITEKPVKAYKEIDLTSMINNYYTSDKNDLTYFISRGINEDSVTEKYKYCSGDIKEIFKDNFDLLPKFNNIGSYDYVIPVWEDDKIVNCILRRNDSKSDENAKTLNLKDVEVKLFNADYLKQSEKLIFITEGIFDCLSIECFDYKSICLNSVNMANRFIDLVKANIDTCKNTKFILCLDNDDKGITATNEIKEELEQLGIRSYILSFNCEGVKDVNEWYLKDVNSLKNSLANAFNPYAISHYLNTFRQNQIANKYRPVISTGFKDLDVKLNGGLYSGLYVLGAISSLGKTALSLQIADNIASQGNNVLFFSLEMPTDELISRSISRKMTIIDKNKCKDIGTMRVLNGHLDVVKDEFETAFADYTENEAKNMTIIQGDFKSNIDSIIKNVAEYIKYTYIKPVVFVDYLQIIKASKDERFSTEKQSIDDIVVKLKMLSRDYNIPVFVVSSFNRENYENRVSFSSFKESGGIEYTADFVLGLQLSVLDEFKDSDKPIERKIKCEKAKEGIQGMREVTLKILKNRNGKSNTQVYFNFYARNNLFIEDEKRKVFDDKF